MSRNNPKSARCQRVHRPATRTGGGASDIAASTGRSVPLRAIAGACLKVVIAICVATRRPQVRPTNAAYRGHSAIWRARSSSLFTQRHPRRARSAAGRAVAMASTASVCSSSFASIIRSYMAISEQNRSPRRPSRNPRRTKYSHANRSSGRAGRRNHTRSFAARRRPPTSRRTFLACARSTATGSRPPRGLSSDCAAR